MNKWSVCSDLEPFVMDTTEMNEIAKAAYESLNRQLRDFESNDMEEGVFDITKPIPIQATSTSSEDTVGTPRSETMSPSQPQPGRRRRSRRNIEVSPTASNTITMALRPRKVSTIVNNSVGQTVSDTSKLRRKRKPPQKRSSLERLILTPPSPIQDFPNYLKQSDEREFPSTSELANINNQRGLDLPAADTDSQGMVHTTQDFVSMPSGSEVESDPEIEKFMMMNWKYIDRILRQDPDIYKTLGLYDTNTPYQEDSLLQEDTPNQNQTIANDIKPNITETSTNTPDDGTMGPPRGLGAWGLPHPTNQPTNTPDEPATITHTPHEPVDVINTPYKPVVITNNSDENTLMFPDLSVDRVMQRMMHDKEMHETIQTQQENKRMNTAQPNSPKRRRVRKATEKSSSSSKNPQNQTEQPTDTVQEKQTYDNTPTKEDQSNRHLSETEYVFKKPQLLQKRQKKLGTKPTSTDTSSYFVKKSQITQPAESPSVSSNSGQSQVTQPAGRKNISLSGGQSRISQPAGRKNISISGGQSQTSQPAGSLGVSSCGGQSQVTQPAGRKDISLSGGQSQTSQPAGSLGVSSCGGQSQVTQPAGLKNRREPQNNQPMREQYYDFGPSQINSREPHNNRPMTDQYHDFGPSQINRREFHNNRPMTDQYHDFGPSQINSREPHNNRPMTDQYYDFGPSQINSREPQNNQPIREQYYDFGRSQMNRQEYQNDQPMTDQYYDFGPSQMSRREFQNNQPMKEQYYNFGPPQMNCRGPQNNQPEYDFGATQRIYRGTSPPRTFERICPDFPYHQSTTQANRSWTSTQRTRGGFQHHQSTPQANYGLGRGYAEPQLTMGFYMYQQQGSRRNSLETRACFQCGVHQTQQPNQVTEPTPGPTDPVVRNQHTTAMNPLQEPMELDSPPHTKTRF